jgi:hypothetical protein
MTITLTPEKHVRVTFSDYDAFLFATRPRNGWPASQLRYGQTPMSLEINEAGDLIDADIPEDTSAAETQAFMAYALEEAHAAIDAHLMREAVA